MVKKLKEIAGGAADTNLTRTVRDSAQQIWLAGLGAFSKAQEEGGRVFEALVKEGQTLEARTRRFAESKMSEMTQQVGKATEDASARATQTWDKLEQVFEDRVSRALGRLGVPTKSDIQDLAQRLDALNAAVQKLAEGPHAKPARKRAAKK